MSYCVDGPPNVMPLPLSCASGIVDVIQWERTELYTHAHSIYVHNDVIEDQSNQLLAMIPVHISIA